MYVALDVLSHNGRSMSRRADVACCMFSGLRIMVGRNDCAVSRMNCAKPRQKLLFVVFSI